jgi:hypothetical protein
MKGTTFVTYFLIFLGSVVLSLVLVYLLLFGGLGIIRSMGHYDARLNSETISSLYSSSSSFQGSFRTIYSLPEGKCTLTITENSIKMKIPSGSVIVGGQDVAKGEKTVVEVKKTTEIEKQIIKPDDISVKSFSTQCSEQEKVQLVIQKEGNEIGVIET